MEKRDNSNLGSQSLLLVLNGLMSFHIGALLAIRKEKPARPINFQYTNERLLRWIGLGMITISLVPTIWVIQEYLQIVMFSGYFGLFARDAETGIEAAPRILASFLVPGALFLLAGCKSYPIGKYLSLFIILSYVIIQFFLGARLWSTMPIIAYTWLWHNSIRHLPKWVIYVSAGATLFLLFPLIATVRELPGLERLDFGVIVEQFISIANPAISIIREMGGTLLTIASTIEIFSRTKGFQWGLTYGYAFLTLVPNLFWDVHPSVAYGSPSRWLVETIAPWTAAKGGGYGYSFIAEAYLNFGGVGAPVVLAIQGLLFARFVRWAQRSGDPIRMATVASWVAFFFIYARGETSSIVRPLLWYAVLPYLLYIFLRRFRGVR
ncbi:MAG: O-antigen polysaccharide polymerase Wzy [Candidatus Methanomethylicaceae archaeon]